MTCKTLLALSLLSSLCVTGCGGSSGGGGSTTTASPTITSVSVSCTPASIQTGQTSQCSATVSGTGNYSSGVTWSATDGTITSAGVFTPSATGTATVTATSTQDTTKSGGTSISIATQTALVVTVSDLPTGALASVTVTNPNGQQTTLTSSQTLSAIPGTYTLAAAPVVVGASTYHATLTTQTATVILGNTSTVIIDYFNIVPNTTKILDQTGAQNLTVSGNGNTLTINSASTVAQSLKPGDVLVSAPVAGATNGLLVKISTVTNSGSSIIVTTTPATLADEVTQAKFGVNIPFVLPNGQPIMMRGPATSLMRANNTARPEASQLTNPCATAGQALSLPFNYSLTPDQNQNTLTTSGEVDFCNLHVDYEIDPLSTFAKVTVSLQQYSDLLVEGQYSTSFNWNQNLSLSDLKSQVVCLGNETCQAVQGLPDSIGNALQVVAPSITPFVGMTGSASGGLYLGGSEAGSFQAGVQIQGLTVSPIYSGTLQQQSYPTAVDGSASVKGYFGVSMGFTLLGSVTAHVDPRAYALLQANTSANPWWTLSGGDEADAGMTLSFLGFGSSEHDTPEYSIYSAPLGQAAGLFSGQPALSLITPATSAQYGPSMNIGLTGSNFAPGCYATLGSSSLSTSYTDPTSLTAVLPASLLTTSGSFPIAVANSSVAGTTSNTQQFTVTSTSTNPAPTIAQLIPASIAAGAAPQTLTINGTGFIASSTVTFNGISHAATFVSATQLTILLTSSNLAMAGTYPVVVTNPTPGGGASNAATVIVTASNSTPAGSAMLGINPQRTNTTSASGPKAQPSFTSIIQGVSGSLRRIGGDGTIIITSPGSCSANLCGVVSAYTSNGVQKWSVQLTLPDGGGLSDVAIAPSGTVYVSTYSTGEVFALSASTGSTLWTKVVNPNGNQSGNFMIDPSGVIYFQSSSSLAANPDKLTAINPDGTTKWDITVPYGVYYQSVMSSDGGLIYLEGTQGPPNNYPQVDSYVTNTGLLSSYNNCQISTVFAAGNGFLFGLLTNNHLAYLTSSLSTCTDLELGNSAIVADAFQAFTGQGVLVASLNSVFTGYSTNGNVLWSNPLKLGGGFADNNGILFEDVLTPGTPSNDVMALDSGSGSVLWRTTLPASVYSGAIANQIMMGPDGSLYVVAGQTLYRATP